ncbi:MAG: DUF1735 domain-containing protein [Prevotella sp.]|jgi:hypothetical protein|nr:DUF1735 domain-containing protein [Prevotella sp.]MCI1281842.1 DUF1735 domain-containing protein [Prevotella sp.]
MQNIKYILMILLGLTTIAFTSCSDSETYDVCGNPNNLVYLSANSTNTFNCAVVHTPVGDFGDIDAKFPVKIQRAATANTEVKAVIDNSLIDTYNTAHNTTYVAAPENMVNITSATILRDTISAMDSIEVSIDKTNFSSLNEEGYLIPFRLEVSGGDAKASEERGVGYVVIKTLKSIVNDYSTKLLGTEQSNDVAKTWTCIAATNLDKDQYSSMLDGDYSSWSFLTKNSSAASFTVDLGATHKVSGFMVSCAMMTNAEVLISTDGNAWTSLGFVNDHKPLETQSGWYSIDWYVLYAGVPTRYVKVNVTLDPNHWYWEYFDWGYATMDGFGLCFDD